MTSFTTIVRLSSAGLALAAAGTAVAAPTFEDRAVGTTYYVGNSDTTNGVFYTFSDFEMIPTVFSNNGHGYIDNLGQACGLGQDLGVENIFVTFDLAGSSGAVVDPTIRFGWYGGAVNLSINGARAWANNPGTLPASLGGCNVVVTPLGGGCGMLEITGTVNRIGLGGQEFWVDTLPNWGTPDDECDWGYEDLTPTLSMPTGTVFTTDGLPSKVRPIMRMDGTIDYTGTVRVSLANAACNTGQELNVDNAILSHDILGAGSAYENVAWAYGYYGGYINFEVNGDHRVYGDLWTLHGQNIGGCQVTIAPISNECGWILLDGVVETIAIGGQELFMDCLKGDEVVPATPGDVDGDGDVDVDDLMALIAAYGSSCSGCPEDLDGDGDVDVDDLMILLGNYGS